MTCTEVVDSGAATGRLACTNIFERQADGEWRIVHHHACPTPRA
jgi:ketosteroid isomerase-like protein